MSASREALDATIKGMDAKRARSRALEAPVRRQEKAEPKSSGQGDGKERAPSGDNRTTHGSKRLRGSGARHLHGTSNATATEGEGRSRADHRARRRGGRLLLAGASSEAASVSSPGNTRNTEDGCDPYHGTELPLRSLLRNAARIDEGAPGMVELMERCLHLDPEKRPTMVS